MVLALVKIEGMVKSQNSDCALGWHFVASRHGFLCLYEGRGRDQALGVSSERQGNVPRLGRIQS